jgi:hypothetical protein
LNNSKGFYLGTAHFEQCAPARCGLALQCARPGHSDHDAAAHADRGTLQPHAHQGDSTASKTPRADRAVSPVGQHQHAMQRAHARVPDPTRLCRPRPVAEAMAAAVGTAPRPLARPLAPTATYRRLRLDGVVQGMSSPLGARYFSPLPFCSHLTKPPCTPRRRSAPVGLRDSCHADEHCTVVLPLSDPSIGSRTYGRAVVAGFPRCAVRRWERLSVDRLTRPLSGPAATSSSTPSTSSFSPTNSPMFPATPPACHRELRSTEPPRRGWPSSVRLLLPAAPNRVPLIAGFLLGPRPHHPYTVGHRIQVPPLPLGHGASASPVSLWNAKPCWLWAGRSGA